MSRERGIPALSRLAFLLVLGSLPAAAQINRAFVSAANGNDGNACNDINAPCLTLQRGVNQVVAGGSVIVLTTGDYGPVGINKPVTIEAGLGVVAFIHPPDGTDAISIGTNGFYSPFVVVLRGLSLYAGRSGDLGRYGITWDGDGSDGGVVRVERCVIHGFKRAIWVLNPGLLVLKDSTIRECETSTLLAPVTSASGYIRVVIEHTRIKGSGGVGGDKRSLVTIRGSNVSGGGGIFAATDWTGKSYVDIEDCVLAHNQVGVGAAGLAGQTVIARLSASTVVYSHVWGLNGGSPGALLSRSNNTIEANAVADLNGSVSKYSAK